MPSEHNEDPAPQGSPDAAALRDLLVTYFSEPELKDLCQDLGIDYEGLPAQGKADKARELVAYAQRHQTMGALLARCRELRSQVGWPQTEQPLPPEGVRASRSSGGPAPSAVAPYHLSSVIIEMLTKICTTPGYHLVLADAGFGKTAIMHYLDCRRRPDTVIYAFNRIEGRIDVDLASKSLREQLQSRGNLPSSVHYPLVELIRRAVGHIQPWSLTYQRNWPHLLMLIDGLDECGPHERALFRDLLPTDLPANVGVVVTLRPTVRAAIEDHFPPSHPLRKSVSIHTLPPLDGTDIRRMLLEEYHIYAEPALCRKIKKLSAGHPASVIAICRSLEEAFRLEHDPDEVLRQIPKLHTFHALFAHELDQMEQHCPGPHDRPLLRRIVSMLAVSRQPLTLDQLAEVLDEPIAAIQAIIQRLDRFLQVLGDGGLAFSLPQFVAYLQELADWRSALGAAQERWDAWVARQEVMEPRAAAFVARVREDLLPALRTAGRPWLVDWAARLSPAIRSYEDWLVAISRAWEVAEGRADPAQPGPDPEELIFHALLITSWPHGPSALPPRGSPSPDHDKCLVLTDQLRDSTQLLTSGELRGMATLMGLFTNNPADEASFDAFTDLVNELGYAWCKDHRWPRREFAQILRLITQAARRQATIAPHTSPRANLLDALSALAPAIRYHFPGTVERICHMVDSIIDVFP